MSNGREALAVDLRERRLLSVIERVGGSVVEMMVTAGQAVAIRDITHDMPLTLAEDGRNPLRPRLLYAADTAGSAVDATARTKLRLTHGEVSMVQDAIFVQSEKPVGPLGDFNAQAAQDYQQAVELIDAAAFLTVPPAQA